MAFDPSTGSDIFGTGSFGGGTDPGLPTLPGSDFGLGSMGPSTGDTATGGGFDWGGLASGVGQIASGIGGLAGNAAQTLGPMALIYNAYQQMGKPLPEQSQLEQMGQIPLAAGTSMIQSASQGQLTVPQKAAVDQYTSQAKEQWSQYFANAGISDSSTKVAVNQQIDQQALAMSQQFIQQSFTSGLAALGQAYQPYMSIMNAQVQRDTALQEAIANAMSAWGMMRGSSGGGSSGGSDMLGQLAQIGGGIAAVASFL